MKPTTKIDIHEAVLCDTSFLGILKVSGDDAQAFLQGQLSNDVNLLNTNTSQFSSYNSPKGRMYACFYLHKRANDFFMLLPKEIIASVTKRLRMFIMRSKVILDDLSNEWESVGLSGNLGDLTTITDKLLHINVPGLDQRRLVVGPAENMDDFKGKLNRSTTSDSNHWKRLDIHAGLPNIYSATQESFVLQMLNLQLIDGVSFTKGCYPGQEVVARMHYLGKLKRRMYRIVISQQFIPAPGDDLTLVDNENTQSVGKIVDAQLNNTGGIDALAVIQSNAIDEKVYINGVEIKIVDLPYSLE